MKNAFAYVYILFSDYTFADHGIQIIIVLNNHLDNFAHDRSMKKLGLVNYF